MCVRSGCGMWVRSEHDKARARGIMSAMPFVTGGVLEEWGPPKRALMTVQREIRVFDGRTDEDDYCVDLAMLTSAPTSASRSSHRG